MSDERKLVGPWRSIHGAVWLIGLAILFWKGWFWPGILVLIGISAIVEAVIRLAMPGSTEPAAEDKKPEEAKPAATAEPPAAAAPTTTPSCRRYSLSRSPRRPLAAGLPQVQRPHTRQRGRMDGPPVGQLRLLRGEAGQERGMTITR